jgi:NitT/TauT family transport system substrate-binding protein
VRTVPETHMQGDRALYLAAFSKMRQSLAVDGTLPDGGALHALRALVKLQGEVEFERIEPARTYTNAFALRAKARFRA